MAQREIIVTRLYEASQQQLWEAWTTAELIEHFFGPEWAPVQEGSASLDVRAGGKLSLDMVDADNGDVYPMRAEYIVVDEPVKIVLRTESGGEMTIEFEDIGEGRTQLKWRIQGDMEDDLYRGATRGLHNCADQLVEVLVSLTANR